VLPSSRLLSDHLQKYFNEKQFLEQSSLKFNKTMRFRGFFLTAKGEGRDLVP
jgi:hypothetical protein